MQWLLNQREVAVYGDNIVTALPLIYHHANS